VSSGTGPSEAGSLAGFQLRTIQRWVGAAVKALPGEDWLRVPAGMRNPPHWLLGHIAISADIGPGLRDVPALVPGEWEQLFGPGTHPDRCGVGYPSPSRLADAAEAALIRAAEVASGLGPAELEAPPLAAVPEGMGGFLRTRERLLGFSVLHLAYHIGQIRLVHRAFHPEAPGL